MLLNSTRRILSRYGTSFWDIPTLDALEDLSSLSAQQQHTRAEALKFSIDRLQSKASLWDSDEQPSYPFEEFRAAAKLNYTKLMLPQAKKSVLEGSLIMEALSHSSVSFAAALSVHNLCNLLFNKAASPNLKAKYSQAISNYENVVSFCLTEAAAGSDPRSLQTRAQKSASGDNYTISGNKVFVTGGNIANLYLVAALTGPQSVSLLLVDRSHTPKQQIVVEGVQKKMGWKLTATTALKFQNCIVPAANLLGKQGEGFKLAMQGLDIGRINIASCSIGAAAAALAKSINYSKSRKQFGQTIDKYQAIQFRIADMITDLAASRLLVRRAASMLDARHPESSMYVAMAKRFATDACSKIVDEAIQIHGGYGYLKKFQLQRHMRDIRAHQILEGTNDIMKLIISRKLLK